MRAIERLMRHVEQVTESGCWIWIGSIDRNGYASVWFNRHSRKAHRVMRELLLGPIPPGLTLDHLCRVRCCVNPYHTEAVTNQINILRGVGITAQNAMKTHCKRGHEFNEDTIIYKKLGRSCRICQRGYQRKSRNRLLTIQVSP